LYEVGQNIDVDPAAAALIAGLGGAAVGFAGALMISSAQRRAEFRRDQREALSGYIGALYPTVGELREMPPNKELDPVNKAIDKLSGEHATWVRTRRALLKISPHLFGRVDRLSLAFARVQVLEMPPEVMVTVESAMNYVNELTEDRSTELIDRWPSLHTELLEAARTLNTRTASPWFWSSRLTMRLRDDAKGRRARI
jgi:hypothetical protein